MFDSDLGIFSGTLPIKGSIEGVNETPEDAEVREITNSEGVEYSEEDLERVETASAIMQEIFTDEVISNWENFSVEERMQYLNEYYTSLGEALGVNTKEIYVADLYEQCGYGVVGVSHGNGVIGVDISVLRSFDTPADMSLGRKTKNIDRFCGNLPDRKNRPGRPCSSSTALLPKRFWPTQPRSRSTSPLEAAARPSIWEILRNPQSMSCRCRKGSGGWMRTGLASPSTTKQPSPLPSLLTRQTTVSSTPSKSGLDRFCGG